MFAKENRYKIPIPLFRILKQALYKERIAK